ncbi:MAG: acyl-CoA carboxylase subunit beta [Mycobacteriales bacterium]
MTTLDVTPTTLEAPPVAVDRDPRLRLAALFSEWRPIVRGAAEDCGVVAGIGKVRGTEVVAFATDPSRQGGAMGADGCAVIASAYRLALRRGDGIVGIWHSGGARLAEGVASLDGVGRIFAAMTHASGHIPQVSVVLGPAAGGAAYGPALTDVVVLGPAGRVFVTGPDVVRSVTGEDVDMEQLGGPDAHGRKSGVVHLVAETDIEAIATAGDVIALLGDRRSRVKPASDRTMADLLPHSPRRAYDVHPVVDTLLDEPRIELHRRWAPNIVTTLGRLGGGPVGVLANNPLRLAGCLDSASAEKAARFVRMCDAFGIPLVVLVDVPGYLPGVTQEWEGVVRRGAKLLHAFAEATVPRVTVVTRKAYGGAYIAMNSRSLGATKVLAWPTAEVAVMGSIAAVRILHRKALAVVPDSERAELEIALAAEHEATSGGVARAVDLRLVDEVIDPDTTRSAVSAAIAAYPRHAGAHRNIPL